jgi:hypothetical protein
MKPTPEEKIYCTFCHTFHDTSEGHSKSIHQLGSGTPEEKCCDLGKEIKTVNDLHALGAYLGGMRTHSPSPEARVDWDEKARAMLALYLDRAILCNIRESLRDDIAKALSAAFEKGREAR